MITLLSNIFNLVMSSVYNVMGTLYSLLATQY